MTLGETPKHPTAARAGEMHGKTQARITLCTGTQHGKVQQDFRPLLQASLACKSSSSGAQVSHPDEPHIDLIRTGKYYTICQFFLSIAVE